VNPSSFSIWHLVATSDPLVKFVLFVLLCASVWSWAIIFTRLGLLKKAQKAVVIFENFFWSGIDLSAYYQKLSKKFLKNIKNPSSFNTDLTPDLNIDLNMNSNEAPQGLEALFYQGFSQFLKTKELPSEDIFLTGLDRKIRITLAEESEKLEGSLSVLATIGSVGPFVGLFGTVWGIMGAFQSLAGVQQATLSMVAPGISEALIATAMGLFVAIPAVVAYNRFSAKIAKLEVRYENFGDELFNLLARQRKNYLRPVVEGVSAHA